MSRIYVKGHYRKRRGTKKGKSSSCLPQVLGTLIAIAVIGYLISAIPKQAISNGFAILFGVIVLVVLIAGGFLTYRLIKSYSLQIVPPTPILQEQQAAIPASLSHQDQAYQPQERERLAHTQTLGDIYTLTDKEFEELIGSLLSMNGYSDVQVVGKSRDLCVDITALDGAGQKVVVQCKRYQPGRKVGTPELQTFIGMMVMHHKADRGIYATTSTFTDQARSLAQGKPIMLIDGKQLVRLLHESLR